MQGQPMGYGALGQMGAAQLMNQQQLQQLSQLQQHMGQIPGMTGYQMTGMAGLGGTSVSMAPPQQQQMGPNGGGATALAGLFYPQRPGEKECEFFMKTGTCKFGSTCKYHHPSDLKHVVLPATSFTGGLDGEQHPRRPGNQCCPHFSKTATCKFGQTCKFDHPPESVHQLIAMTATNGEHPRRPGESACSYFMRTGTCKYGPTCRFDHPQRRDGAAYGGGPGKMGGPMGANPYMTNAYGGSGGAGGFDRFNDRMRPRFPDRPKFPGTFRNYGSSSGGNKDATGGNTHWILADKDSGSEEEQPSVLFTSYDELQRYAANAKDVMIFSGTSEEDVKNKAGPLGKYVVAAPNSNKRGREEDEVDTTDGGPLLKRLREALNKPSPYLGLVQCPLCPVPRIVKFKAMSLEEMWTFEVSGDKPEEAFNSPDLLAHMKEKHNEVLSLATGKDWPSVSSVMFDVAAIHLSRKTEPLDGWPLVFDDSLFGHVRRLVDAWCVPTRRTEKVWQDGGVCRRVKAIVGPDEESEEVVTIRDRLREMARKYSDKAWEDDLKANGKGEDQATNTGAHANAMKEEPEDSAEITYPVYANGAPEGEAEAPVEETLVAVAETA